MAKNKKPKFLEKETPELLILLKDSLSNEDDADIKKTQKIVDELISRLPGETGPISVDEALQAAAASMTEALNQIKAAYDNEVSMIEDSDDSDEKEEEETKAPEKKPSKASKGSKKSKKVQEEPEEEEEEEEEEEDSDEEDYSDWSTKDLKKECRDRGIKVTKGMSKADMVKALEADDQE